MTTTPDGIVTFSEGLPGFEQSRQFVLVASPALQPFTVIRGVEAEAPAFVAIDPRHVDPRYPTVLARVDLARLAADERDPLLWLAIITTHENGAITANLRAPIVINPATMRGLQLINVETDYPIAHPLRAA